ncbi:hypothetical protein AN478_00945 [Thiohalorhabdus denitrificans]|uniref:Isoquinoline 1-oxidoreductase, beta subunit n=1 Tax=Thiohalorhabdus denitrificans TaxID=381306 RepID=A0A0P9C8Q0_9GAMM|nr:xanthine dehydrogenase family protein molybdopterin-binding subunit [Thiohalorhabdus denitrificans]KPV41680.1 hypothetical protein AN478_00945 [Thiohalorhabdus denitrificans]SCY55774.1 isoquinoline 1-oxidoreductase, beta subunit [Thiohalorhabdus denitrificans]
MPGSPVKTTRRSFLKASAAVGGGLLLGVRLPVGGRNARAAEEADGGEAFAPNAWVRIDRDDQVTVLVDRSEMGQGVMTAIPMLVAEELEADWDRIRTEFAPADEAYTNALLGRQATGGSTAVRAAWRPLREAGAAARAMLVAAAAGEWDVDPGSLEAANQVVRHPGSGREATYGDLAEAAAGQEVPEAVLLKEPSEFRLLGQPRDRLDSAAKVDGSATFGMDVKLPGLLTAQVVRCPVIGGRPARVDGEAAKRVPGVKDVFEIEAGVAVVAEGFWAAQKGREALRVEWDYGEHAGLTSAQIARQFREAADSDDAAAVREEGDIEQALAEGAQSLEAEYEVPFLAHVCMEPMNCTARIADGVCEVWAPTQDQTSTQEVAVEISGLDPENVHVHTTFLGGGFGRRSHTDFVADAVETAKKAGAPVKVVWTREDTTRHDRYRPATYNRLAAAVNGSGEVTGWRHRIAGPSIMAYNDMLQEGQRVDSSSVEVAKEVPYAVPSVHVDYAMSNTPVPLWWWRSVGASQNGFIREAFFDEVAAAAGEDPYELRRRLLQDQPRHLGVLERAAEQAGWGGELPEGRARGIAVVHSFGSYCAEVAEVSVSDNREVRVHRVDVAIDCGQTVNPEIITEQMESGVAYGLSAALHEAVTVDRGQVEQANFDSYPILTMNQMPEVHVHIVDSDEEPGGVGEPGTPPIAPAVANAIFALKGEPVRRLPLSRAGFRPA